MTNCSVDILESTVELYKYLVTDDYVTMAQYDAPRLKYQVLLCGKNITKDMLEDASKFFNENCGFWGAPLRGERCSFGEPGSHVKMSVSRLRTQYLPEGSRGSYATVTIDGVLAGNAFACRWQYEDRQVCWVTQLVVHRDYREQRLATHFLLSLLDNDDEIFGIISRHPAACKAVARVRGNFAFSDIPLNFAKQHAASIMGLSPIRYIRDALLCGSLFQAWDKTGLRCGVDSNFHVDHTKPLQVLDEFGDEEWPLGSLPNGRRFLLLFKVPRRRRPRYLDM